MLEKITQALVAAYKKDKDGYTDNVFVDLGEGSMRMYVQKEVVDDVFTPATEISQMCIRDRKEGSVSVRQKRPYGPMGR